jgi:hypothetical protein
LIPGNTKDGERVAETYGLVRNILKEGPMTTFDDMAHQKNVMNFIACRKFNKNEDNVFGTRVPVPPEPLLLF